VITHPKFSIIQVFDWDKDEAHRFLGSLKVSLEELVYAEEGVTDKEFDLVIADFSYN
jgi:hypothetical protein